MTLIKIYYGSSEQRFSLAGLDFHPELLQLLEEMGIIETGEGWIDANNLKRLRKALYLRNCLGVNLPGTAIILDLLERIEELEQQLERLAGK